MQRHILAFSEAHLNIVLNALADKPYREVAEIIGVIDRQMKARAPRAVPDQPNEGTSDAA